MNTYALFAEHNRAALGPRGRAGFIVPTGIATDDSTKEYFVAIVGEGQLFSLFDFENTAAASFFKDVGHGNIKFSLITLSRTPVQRPTLVFYAHGVAETRDADRQFQLAAEDFAILNPNTLTCPTFRSRRDADINLVLYSRAGVLWREGSSGGNPWGLRLMAMLHMAGDSGLFRSAADLERMGCGRAGNRYNGVGMSFLPLVEAKMVSPFDHRFGDYGDRPAGVGGVVLPSIPAARMADPDYQPMPQYWVAETDVDKRLRDRWARRWLLGWRDITRAVDQRTVFASLIPRTGVGHTTPVMFTDADPVLVAALYANLAAFALDYAARQKLGGTHLTYSYLKQLPVLAPGVYAGAPAWSATAPAVDWLLPRVLELTYTAWDLEPFAKDVGYDGPPFRWDPARRFLLRAELDAAFFHLYGLSREDADYILDTFPIVRKHDEKAHGEYRTKRVILEIYDAMAEAAKTGLPYQTRLEPAPASASQAHAARPSAVVAASPIPIEDLPAGTWARPELQPMAENGAALAAVLKRLAIARSARDVRLLTLIVLEPRLLVPALTPAEATHWRRLVGTSARPLPQNVAAFVPFADQAWRRALSHLRGTECLIEDTGADTWAPGPGLATIDTAGWPDGRAAFVAERLETLGRSRLIEALPDVVRRSLDEQAA